jgi:superfamily II DNA or RNA helicase
MLVYVPEGYEPDYSENENYDIDIEDKRIIDEYSEIISKLGITTHQILGETKERTKLLEQFEDGIISTLTAMKTLDEGVDIPATKYAIFCASTGNERQFIQRRGRILRNFPGKESAYVYDIIIEPNESLWENEHIDLIDKIKKNEVNAFKSEIGRVANFLYCCHNLDDIFISKDENYIKLISLCEKYDIPLQTNILELKNKDKNC